MADADPTLDILRSIRESAYSRWEKRRDYEWKLIFAIWTALAAFIAITISQDINLPAGALRIGCAIVISMCESSIGSKRDWKRYST